LLQATPHYFSSERQNDVMITMSDLNNNNKVSYEI